MKTFKNKYFEFTPEWSGFDIKYHVASYFDLYAMLQLHNPPGLQSESISTSYKFITLLLNLQEGFNKIRLFREVIKISSYL